MGPFPCGGPKWNNMVKLTGLNPAGVRDIFEAESDQNALAMRVLGEGWVKNVSGAETVQKRVRNDLVAKKPKSSNRRDKAKTDQGTPYSL